MLSIDNDSLGSCHIEMITLCWLGWIDPGYWAFQPCANPDAMIIIHSQRLINSASFAHRLATQKEKVMFMGMFAILPAHIEHVTSIGVAAQVHLRLVTSGLSHLRAPAHQVLEGTPGGRASRPLYYSVCQQRRILQSSSLLSHGIADGPSILRFTI